MRVERTCQYCAKIFIFKSKPSNKNKGKFCSKKCCYRSKQIINKCKYCGKQFTVSRSRIAEGNGRGKYCSKECYLKDKSKNIIERKCLSCDNTFRVHYKNKRKKYCSIDCRRKATSFTKKCLVCGKQFRVSYVMDKKGFGIYCSKKCFYEEHRIIIKCQFCGKDIYTTKGKKNRKYCSIQCQRKAYKPWNKGKTGQYILPKRRQTQINKQKAKNLICKWCGKKFYAPKYRIDMGMKCCCSEHENLYEKNRNTIIIYCRGCGKKMLVKLRYDNHSKTIKRLRPHRTFCSEKCKKENYLAIDRFCAMCGRKIKVRRSESDKHKHNFCSKKCSNEGLKLEAALYGKKGITYNHCGHRIKATKEYYDHINKEGKYKRKYRPEHRIIIERYLHRKLKYNSEPVWHINGIVSDNRIQNLYVFPNRSELTKVITGYNLAPTKSNLPNIKMLEDESYNTFFT